MKKTFQNKEEVLKRIKKKAGERVVEIYDDWFYQTLEIMVCDVNYGDGICVVPEVVGRWIENKIASDMSSSSVFSLGNVVVRMYTIRSLRFHKGRFASLDDWGKITYLKTNPDVFKEHEKNFSPGLKKYLKELKKKVKEEGGKK